MTNAINGTDLLVYVDGVAVACATTCSLNINQETVDSTCKDVGVWANSIPGRKSWDVSVDGLYQLNNDIGFTGLSNLILDDDINDVTLDFGQKDVNFYWTGEAILTSISLTGDDNAPGSFSASFTGVGSLTQQEAV